MAAAAYDDYLEAVAQSHSIPVMDREVTRFLATQRRDALLLDIGGCWGWHWRRIGETRRDVGVVVVDFVRGNLAHAKRVLGALVGRVRRDVKLLANSLLTDIPGLEDLLIPVSPFGGAARGNWIYLRQSLEWLRRRDPKLAEHLRTYLFTKEPVTEIEAVVEHGGGAEAAAPSSDGSLGIGSLRTAGGARR